MLALLVCMLVLWIIWRWATRPRCLRILPAASTLDRKAMPTTIVGLKSGTE